MGVRKDYKQLIKQSDEYSAIVMGIIFWTLIAACFLLFSIPRRIIDGLINTIDEDMKNYYVINGWRKIKIIIMTMIII